MISLEANFARVKHHSAKRGNTPSPSPSVTDTARRVPTPNAPEGSSSVASESQSVERTRGFTLLGQTVLIHKGDYSNLGSNHPTLLQRMQKAAQANGLQILPDMRPDGTGTPPMHGHCTYGECLADLEKMQTTK